MVPVRVQGEEAAGEIAAALDLVNAMALADLIITGRGGGSMEDLWAFNEEIVAQAIFRSRLPVISAVGHEPDVTISDYVADRRASTPSNAAELAVPDQEELRQTLDHLYHRLDRAMDRRLRERQDALARLGSSPFLRSPLQAVREKRMALDLCRQRLIRAMERKTGETRQTIGRLAAALDALSPFKVLGRGYAISYTEDGAVLTSVRQAKAGDPVDLRVSDGTLHCRVEGKERHQWQKKS